MIRKNSRYKQNKGMNDIIYKYFGGRRMALCRKRARQ